MQRKLLLACGLVICGLALWFSRAARVERPPPTARSAQPRAASAPPPKPTPQRPSAEPEVEAGVAPDTEPPLSEEAAIMQRLRAVQDADPQRALSLAHEAMRRFPRGPDAPERAAIVVKSLARLGRLSEARGEAERMVNEYPESPWAREVERQTGAHPRLNH